MPDNKYNYGIEKDDQYVNTFQIWDNKNDFPSDLNNDIGEDDQIITDFAEMQRKANAYPKLVKQLQNALEDISKLHGITVSISGCTTIRVSNDLLKSLNENIHII